MKGNEGEWGKLGNMEEQQTQFDAWRHSLNILNDTVLHLQAINRGKSEVKMLNAVLSRNAMEWSKSFFFSPIKKNSLK